MRGDYPASSMPLNIPNAFCAAVALPPGDGVTDLTRRVEYPREILPLSALHVVGLASGQFASGAITADGDVFTWVGPGRVGMGHSKGTRKGSNWSTGPAHFQCTRCKPSITPLDRWYVLLLTSPYQCSDLSDCGAGIAL
jgi:hypothetical protein